MSKDRLQAFSDGVIAILITIMVLNLHAPQQPAWSALRPVLPSFLTYLLSFVFLGIYWSNHHHLLQAADRVSGAVLWANLHLLFWLSLFPFVTEWAGSNHFAGTPVALYGVIMLLAGIAYYLLSRTLVLLHGEGSVMAAAIGNDFKGRISVAIYAAAVPVAFADARIAWALYIGVAVVWLIPDRRIERKLAP
jgi:uncharacterized membrane protein